jgi:DNA-binding ferritin-like protein (Dps family)
MHRYLTSINSTDIRQHIIDPRIVGFPPDELDEVSIEYVMDEIANPRTPTQAKKLASDMETTAIKYPEMNFHSHAGIYIAADKVEISGGKIKIFINNRTCQGIYNGLSSTTAQYYLTNWASKKDEILTTRGNEPFFVSQLLKMFFPLYITSGVTTRDQLSVLTKLSNSSKNVLPILTNYISGGLDIIINALEEAGLKERVECRGNELKIAGVPENYITQLQDVVKILYYFNPITQWIDPYQAKFSNRVVKALTEEPKNDQEEVVKLSTTALAENIVEVMKVAQTLFMTLSKNDRFRRSIFNPENRRDIHKSTWSNTKDVSPLYFIPFSNKPKMADISITKITHIFPMLAALRHFLDIEKIKQGEFAWEHDPIKFIKKPSFIDGLLAPYEDCAKRSIGDPKGIVRDPAYKQTVEAFVLGALGKTLLSD